MNLSIPPSKLPLIVAPGELRASFSIQHDAELQRLISESERIGNELEQHLPVTQRQTPLGVFIDPREIYLELATKQSRSRELGVSKEALQSLEEYTNNVMERVSRLITFLQEKGICPQGRFERTFNSIDTGEQIEVSFMPSEFFTGYSLKISNVGEKAMFNIAFIRYPKAEPELTQGVFVRNDKSHDWTSGRNQYVTLQLDKGNMFLDFQLDGKLNNRRRLVADETLNAAEPEADCITINSLARGLVLVES